MDSSENNLIRNRSPIRITVIYLLLGVLWILVSDYILALLTPDKATFQQFQTFKGWFFIFITAWLLYTLIRGTVNELEKSKLKLEHSEERLRLALESSDEGIWDWNPLLNKIYYSPAWKKMLGFRETEIADIYEEWDKRIHSEDRSTFYKQLNDHLQGNTPEFNTEYRILCKNGEYKWVQAQGKVIERNSKGIARRIIGTHRDISLRKAKEQEIQTVNRALRVLSLCNQAVISSVNEQHLLDNISRIIVEQGGYKLVWVGYKMTDEDATVKPAAQFGFEDGYLDKIIIHSKDDAYGKGPTAKAIRTGEVSVAKDILKNSEYDQWKDEAISRGYKSSIALPLKVADETIGALNIYSSLPDAFDQSEISLLKELADNLSYGISFLRSKVKLDNTLRELKLSQERFNLSARAARTGVWDLDINSRMIFLGPNLMNLLGFPELEQTLSYEEWLMIIHPEDRELVNNKIRHYLEEGKRSFEFEHRIIHKTGETRWFLVRGESVRNHNNKLSWMRGTSTDITESVKMKKALQEFEKRFHTAFDSLNETFIIYDDERKIQFINRHGISVSGKTESELIGKTDEEIFSEDIYSSYLPFLIEAVKSKTPVKGEARMRLQGKEYFLQVNYVPQTDENGKLKNIYAITQDISGLKKTEELIRQSEQKYRLLVEQAAEGILILDKNLRILEVNPSVSGMSGYENYELLNQHLGNLIKFNNLQKEENLNKLKQGEIVTLRGSLNRKDKYNLPVEIIAHPIDGDKIYVMVRDISERQSYENALIRSKEEYRMLVRKLEKVREEERAAIAREIHDELGQLLTGLKFELSSINRKLKDDQAELKSKTTHLMQRIDENIRIVRKISYRLRPSELDDLGLAAAIESYLNDIRKTGLNLKLLTNKSDLNIDQKISVALYRILQESITNILRHANARNVTVTLNEYEDWYEMTVTDDGKGIDESEIKSRTTLGLLGMEERVALLGGYLKISNADSGGTKVTVRVPVKESYKNETQNHYS
ncbi:MAG: hypothetical protein Kow0098_27880 [Ignavibacteriaceae bacterium]